MRRWSQVAGSIRRGSLVQGGSEKNKSIPKTPLDDMSVQLSTKAAASNRRMSASLQERSVRILDTTTATTSTNKESPRPRGRTRRASTMESADALPPLQKQTMPQRHSTATLVVLTDKDKGDAPEPVENGMTVKSSNNNNPKTNPLPLPNETAPAPINTSTTKGKTNDTKNKNPKATRTRPTRQRSSSLSELRPGRRPQQGDDSTTNNNKGEGNHSTATASNFSRAFVKYSEAAVDRIQARIEARNKEKKRRHKKVQEQEHASHPDKKQPSTPSKQEKQQDAAGIGSSHKNGNKMEPGQPESNQSNEKQQQQQQTAGRPKVNQQQEIKGGTILLALVPNNNDYDDHGKESNDKENGHKKAGEIIWDDTEVEEITWNTESPRDKGDMSLSLSAKPNGMQTNAEDSLTTNTSFGVAAAPTKRKDKHSGPQDRKARATRNKPTRQRSKSLTSMKRPLRGGTRSNRALHVTNEAVKTHTFFFDDDYRDNDPIAKLDAQEVEQSVVKLREKVEKLQMQLEETQEAELSEIAEEFEKCVAMKDGFVAANPKKIHSGEDQQDAVRHSKDIIAYLKQKNANRRKENKTLKVNLFDMQQKTVILDKATRTTLNCLEELEEVHLRHELEKNELLYQNLASYRRAHDKLSDELDRRTRAGLMEHRICHRYNETLDAIQRMFHEVCEDYDLVLEITDVDSLW